MDISDSNKIIRDMINDLLKSGWLKTHIGKVLLGANGQAHLNHFLKESDDGEFNDFGIKPLSKIGNVIGYDVHVSFVPNQYTIEETIDRDETIVDSLKFEKKQEALQKFEETIKILNNYNLDFNNTLKAALLNYLNNNIKNNSNITLGVNRNQIDLVLDEVLGI